MKTWQNVKRTIDTLREPQSYEASIIVSHTVDEETVETIIESDDSIDFYENSLVIIKIGEEPISIIYEDIISIESI